MICANVILVGEGNSAKILAALVKVATAVVTENATVQLIFVFVVMGGQEMDVRYQIAQVIQIAILEVNTRHITHFDIVLIDLSFLMRYCNSSFAVRLSTATSPEICSC